MDLILCSFAMAGSASGNAAHIRALRFDVSTFCSFLENAGRMEEFSRQARERAFRKYTWSSIAWEWTAILENMPVAQVHARWSGPLSLLQKTQTYLQNGNVNAATRVLTALDATPFFR